MLKFGCSHGNAGASPTALHIRCGSNLGPAELEDDVAALEPVLGGKSVRVDLPKHCQGVRSSAARGRRRIGRGIWADRNSADPSSTAPANCRLSQRNHGSSIVSTCVLQHGVIPGSSQTKVHKQRIRLPWRCTEASPTGMLSGSSEKGATILRMEQHSTKLSGRCGRQSIEAISKRSRSAPRAKVCSACPRMSRRAFLFCAAPAVAL